MNLVALFMPVGLIRAVVVAHRLGARWSADTKRHTRHVGRDPWNFRSTPFQLPEDCSYWAGVERLIPLCSVTI